MKCNKCSQEIPDNSKFCLHCGTKVELTDSIVCPKCGYKNPSDATFCTECGNSLQSLLGKEVHGSNELDANKYNFLQFRGLQIYGTIANVEETLYRLGYQKRNGLFVGTYAGFEDSTIEIRISGATKHVNELLIMIAPSYDVNQARTKLVEALKAKYGIDGHHRAKKGTSFITPSGEINIHRDFSEPIPRLKIRYRGFDDVYKQYDTDKHNQEVSILIGEL